MPNRIIKESICTSEDIDQMGAFVETFFYRLLVSCDDYGRLDARPAILRAKLFPLRVDMPLEDVEAALAALAEIGCVSLYAQDGRPYLCLPAWAAHQRIRTQRAKYPPPPSAADGRRPPPESESESQSQSESQSEQESEAESEASPVAAAARALGMPFAKKDDEIALALVQEFTEAWVLEAMTRAADGPSRTWRYIRGILRGWQAAGGIDPPGRPAKQTRAQQYTQKHYTKEELAGLVEVL